MDDNDKLKSKILEKIKLVLISSFIDFTHRPSASKTLLQLINVHQVIISLPASLSLKLIVIKSALNILLHAPSKTD